MIQYQFKPNMGIFFMKSCQREHVLTKLPCRGYVYHQNGDIKHVKLRASHPECTTS